MRLEDITAGKRLLGIVQGEPAEVIAVKAHGADAATVTYRSSAGQLGERVLYRTDEPGISEAPSASRPFDADAHDFRLVAEAQRIKMAGLFDPMLAVTTSDIDPLPHQIRAVYGELLPRSPLRFLLADDPGAGKTIMAGLYIKELLLRDDVKRCLIVAPGGLVEQWQDELFFKFGLRFELLTNQLVDATIGQSVFDQHPLLIARMDQLARNEDLQSQMSESEWDLVIVDEAHRMGAHYFGGKLEKTKRFQLGEMLGDRARHFLLMTATPHSGKEEDFQLFLTLLDRDRYAGKYQKKIHSADTTGVMRRMVKEDLLTFEGKPLFPERIAQTVPYELTDLEQELYEQVTSYVKEGMNRAEKLDGKHRNTVGFALTVLQRRLASSPEAIYKSLGRRVARLEHRKQDILNGTVTDDPVLPMDVESADDPDEHNAAEMEEIEEELLDSATAARTVEELDAEIAELRDLVAVAKRVRDIGEDRKWVELRTIVQDEALAHGTNGHPRKLIIFTEHRDTLDYLSRKIGTLLGKPETVVAIHGGVRRSERRRITEEFTKNPDCQFLLATDAAGEGLNLQAAHLMVNYDLPWNPNRIEQRFGRVHRIGQQEVCRLWNLVATNTREGMVFERLLEKVEEQREAYGGKVFDVLGDSFRGESLRDLLIEAIKHGEQPEVRAHMHQVIDAGVSEGLQALLQERALANDSLPAAELEELRLQMDDARARRLQPHYIEWAFRGELKRLGGRMAKRERARFEISNVPARVRASTGHMPVATRYERVTFDLDAIAVEGRARADLLAPGHPLHDAVTDQTIAELGDLLHRGTALVSPTIQHPSVLVGVVEEIVDDTGASVARRFGYAFVDQAGEVAPAGVAPYLDCVAAPDSDALSKTRSAGWVADAEAVATSWMIAQELPKYLHEVGSRRGVEIERTRTQVKSRLQHEINRLSSDALVAQEKEHGGGKAKESSESLTRKAEDLQQRLTGRMALLERQAHLTTKSPRVVTAALVLPMSEVDDALPADTPMHAVATEEVERRGVDLVLQTERAMGRSPEEQAHNNPGFDVLSRRPDNDLPLRIEVKARIAGSDDLFVTHTEILTGKNAHPRYRLALVSVDPRGPEHDEVRYLDHPFDAVDIGGSDVTGVRMKWAKTWDKGSDPF